MKQTVLVLTALVVILMSCNSKKNVSLLTSSNLPVYFITVNSDSGYRLKTPHGAVISIYPGTFDVPANSKVKIEIKEAYSLQDMLLGGLTTESNGKPLKSAGMLFFGATADNKDVKFLKPVKAILPSKTYDSSMHVYKGEIKEDSSINWVEEKKMDTSLPARNLLIGKELFRANCASCHKPYQDFAGPALASARRRAPFELLYRFVKYPAGMISSNGYAEWLFNKWKPTVMTAFPQLRRSDIKAILDYCDNEANIAYPETGYDSLTSMESDMTPCGMDTFYYPKPKSEIEELPFKEDEVQIDTTVISSSDSLLTTANNDDSEEFTRKGYSDIVTEEGMYQFNIDASGWYNTDAIYHDPKAVKVKLIAETQGEDMVMDVYLCIPQRKILIRADYHKANEYLFPTSDADGFISMIKGDDALIFATASVKNKAFYGITPFRISDSQIVPVKIKESTKEQILQAFRNNQLDSIKLDIQEKEIEIIRKPCDGMPTTSSLIPVRSNP